MWFLWWFPQGLVNNRNIWLNYLLRHSEISLWCAWRWMCKGDKCWLVQIQAHKGSSYFTDVQFKISCRNSAIMKIQRTRFTAGTTVYIPLTLLIIVLYDAFGYNLFINNLILRSLIQVNTASDKQRVIMQVHFSKLGCNWKVYSESISHILCIHHTQWVIASFFYYSRWFSADEKLGCLRKVEHCTS